jgi:hypothetical protein
MVIKYGFMVIGFVAVFKLVSSLLFYVAVLGMPFLFTYLYQTCPPQATFDSKERLKMVLQGSHLPDDHPDKPKGYVQQFLSSTRASVTAELSSFMGSTQTQFTPLLGGVAVLVTVTIPKPQQGDETKKDDVHGWIGIRNEWYYIPQLSSSAATSTAPPITSSNGSSANCKVTDRITATSSITASNLVASAAIAALSGSTSGTQEQ